VARIVAFVPDLLFGSSVLTSLRSAGRDVALVDELRPGTDTEVLIVDLTVDAAHRIELVGALDLGDVRTLAFYSHVEHEVREMAERAGFDLVVPRSRMAREGAALVERLLAASG